MRLILLKKWNVLYALIQTKNFKPAKLLIQTESILKNVEASAVDKVILILYLNIVTLIKMTRKLELVLQPY